MGTVIYSASPFQAFLGTFETVPIIFVIGLLGIGLAIFRRNQGRSARLLLGILGIFLLIASFVTAAFTLTSVSNGAQTVTANLNNKTIAEDNCGDNGETCQRFVLETVSNAIAYDFNVPQAAYDKTQVNTCYIITYYPNKDLFSNAANTYLQINNVSRIETADPGSCQ
jgi:hypothetical protein